MEVKHSAAMAFCQALVKLVRTHIGHVDTDAVDKALRDAFVDHQAKVTLGRFEEAEADLLGSMGFKSPGDYQAALARRIGELESEEDD